MNPPREQLPPLQIWKITLCNGEEEQITAVGYQINPDGSVIFGDVQGVITALNRDEWSRIDRSAIRPAGGLTNG